ncbi:MAG: hypothetical protein AAGD38_00260, partial [Acidobacteriota bacterium]
MTISIQRFLSALSRVFAAIPVALVSVFSLFFVGCGDSVETPVAEIVEAAPLVAFDDAVAGYQPRACGFDLDDDGVRGGASDCAICDGTTTDPDGDGVDEDLIYVDCAAGTDTPTCGTAAEPCGSLAHAWTVIADGAADGAEDIVCFRGTCDTEKLTPFGGVAGTAKHDGFAYPRDPAMLVGWDHDGDAIYPPADVDDVAVLTGSGVALLLDAQDDYLELAHFTASGYGRTEDPKGDADPRDSGFLRVQGGGDDPGALEHLYVHDVVLAEINRGRKSDARVVTLDLTSAVRPVSWAFENLDVIDNGGWFVLGVGPDAAPDAGPLRFRHLTRTTLGCNVDDCATGAASTAFFLRGYFTGIDILDSVWDANVGAWQPKPTGGPPGARFVAAAPCAQTWRIERNEVIDYKNALVVQPYIAGRCDGAGARPVHGVTFADNVVRNGYEPWAYGDVPVRIEAGGELAGETLGLADAGD